jgi:hypothetical protein
MTQARVRAAWGTRYGVCRGCLERTWYFTHEAGRPEGAGVSFRKGVTAFYVVDEEVWGFGLTTARLGACR